MYMRNDEWELLELETDPISGDPDEIMYVAGKFGAYSEQLRTAVDAPQYTKSTGVEIKGQYSEAFDTKRSEMYTKLTALYDLTSRVHVVLNAWSDTVSDLQQRISQLLDQAQSYQTEVNKQSGIISSYQRDMRANVGHRKMLELLFVLLIVLRAER